MSIVSNVANKRTLIVIERLYIYRLYTNRYLKGS